MIDRHHMHRQTAERGFLLLGLHVGTGLAHGLNNLIQADVMGAVAFQSQRGSRDRFDCAQPVALDAGDLHLAIVRYQTAQQDDTERALKISYGELATIIITTILTLYTIRKVA